MEANEILKQMDSCQGVLPFLANDGRMHLADTRLTVFRSAHDWALFVEIPHYFEGTADFHNWLGGVGSCLIEGDCTWGDQIGADSLFEEVPDAPLWKHGIGNEPWRTWLGDRAEFSILFDGKRYDFAPTDADYRAAGILFGDQRTGSGSIEPGYLLRFLCHQLHHPFFASESQLRNFMDNSSEMELFIQTRQ